jgi:hypothetical protein
MILKPVHLVFIAIAVILMLLEFAIRIFENDLSGNLNHINEIPEIVQQYKQDQRPKILFLGNSLINEAVDVDQLSNKLSGRYLVDKITPDATSLWDWNMIMKNRVFASGADIDYLVIGFAWGLLADEYRPNPSRLGGYFTGLADSVLLYDYGMRSFAQYSEFLLGWMSKLFVNREAVRNKVLVNLIPHYEQYVRAQNQAGKPDKTDQAEQNVNADTSDYKILYSLLERLEKDGTKLIVIAMPVEEGYAISPELTALLKRHTHDYLDYRDFLAGTERVYKDGVHLNEKGRGIFTASLNRLFSRDI